MKKKNPVNGLDITAPGLSQLLKWVKSKFSAAEFSFCEVLFERFSGRINFSDDENITCRYALLIYFDWFHNTNSEYTNIQT